MIEHGQRSTSNDMRNAQLHLDEIDMRIALNEERAQTWRAIRRDMWFRLRGYPAGIGRGVFRGRRTG